MVTVLIEGAVGSDPAIVAKQAEQFSNGGGWEHKVIDGRRQRARVDVATTVRRYQPDLLVICCADEVRVTRRPQTKPTVCS